MLSFLFVTQKSTLTYEERKAMVDRNVYLRAIPPRTTIYLFENGKYFINRYFYSEDDTFGEGSTYKPNECWRIDGL